MKIDCRHVIETFLDEWEDVDADLCAQFCAALYNVSLEFVRRTMHLPDLDTGTKTPVWDLLVAL
jgi:hypothetical protein